MQGSSRHPHPLPERRLHAAATFQTDVCRLNARERGAPIPGCFAFPRRLPYRERLATLNPQPETQGMIFELINTGSELMLGRVLNTHQQWLCRQLADLGWVVSRQVAVPDDGPAIQQAAREAL